MNQNNKYFKVQLKGKYYRLTHIPSGDYIQQHLCDFLTRRHAIECRDRVLVAAPDWDWSDAGLFEEMGSSTFRNVWHAIYAETRYKDGRLS